MKILICGDSFCVTDPMYPGLHWSEKMLNSSGQIEIWNLAYGGSSNALIVYQLMQGLMFKPDFVILSFTSNGRYEFDKNIDAVPFELSAESIAAYQKERYTTNCYRYENKDILSTIDRYRLTASSDNFEKLKNYFHISFCLTLLKHKNIDFCFSLGGFEYKQDYTALLNNAYVENLLSAHRAQELSTNLWYHQSNNKLQPTFHVDSEAIHTLFNNECLARIKKNSKC